MRDDNFSILDVLDLPPREREVFLYVARRGPVDGDALAAATGQAPDDIRAALACLLQKQRLRRLNDGLVDACFGRVGGRTTLPPQLWPALLTTDRLYSEQEIATLRVAAPLLQFARARMSEFADHGPNHALRVRSLATQLGYIVGLTRAEQHALRAAALFHDIGNVVDRERHHIISQEAVERLAADGELPFTRTEAELIGLLCRWHRREFDPSRIDTLDGEHLRTGLLASLLRVADAMDIDHRRSDYDQRFRKVLQFFYPQELPYWTSLEQILGVRIRCAPAVSLQVFSHGPVTENHQIAMLRKDLASTPLDWSVQEVAVADHPLLSSPAPAPPAQVGRDGRALVVFPFEAHSLVMAALSRRQLIDCGCAVEVVSYPDTAGGPLWLWGELLPQIGLGAFERLIVIGDHYDPRATIHLVRTVKRWRTAGRAVSILNRHEGNWSRLPGLLALDVEVCLGSDWAYFWGDAASQTDLAWGRVAALCVRDQTLPTVGLTAEEQAVSQGLLNVVYDTLGRPAADTAGWAALAEPILDRIDAGERAFFANQADSFTAAYATVSDPGCVEGRVLRFEQRRTDMSPALVPP